MVASSLAFHAQFQDFLFLQPLGLYLLCCFSLGLWLVISTTAEVSCLVSYSSFTPVPSLLSDGLRYKKWDLKKLIYVYECFVCVCASLGCSALGGQRRKLDLSCHVGAGDETLETGSSKNRIFNLFKSSCIGSCHT